MIFQTKHPLIGSRHGLGYCIRAHGAEEAIAKISSPVLILVDVDGQASLRAEDRTGASTISRRLWRVEVELAFEDFSELLYTVMCSHCCGEWMGGHDRYLCKANGGVETEVRYLERTDGKSGC